MRKTFWSLMMVLMLMPLRLGAQSRVVGWLISVTGRVEVKRDRLPSRKLLSRDQLWLGDLLQVRAKSSARIVLNSSRVCYALSADSRCRVERDALKRLSGPTPKAGKPLGPMLLRNLNASPQPLSDTTLAPVIRGDPDAAFRPTEPTPIGAVRAAAVTLRWKIIRQDGAAPETGIRLHVQVRDVQTGSVLCENDLPATVREFPIPEQTLEPGHRYAWSVVAIGSGIGVQSCIAAFRVLTAEERTDLEQVERAAAEALRSAPEDPVPDLLLADAYERLDMFVEAIAAYEAALKIVPEDEGAQAAVQRLRKLVK